ncbi:hypothetical protein [Aromatoleum anaerobium]|uniref:PIN domain-containing protein n=1 Tax=Aromatoleum anaerobium TaxID=182180 RepID=A0ABX1PQZ3_9RHOO|nr:hypothetical protein [Aromatoleum anaerobium]MCK0508590.1 hypothetical protein [Aromatoleum anaerobium]
MKEFSSSSNALAAAPIPELFRQLFGISGSKDILPDVLNDLIERGRIHRVVEDGRVPSLLRIIDLAPGRSGRDMTREPILSEADKQAAQTRKIERYFDPVLEEIVGADDLVPQPQDANHFCVPAEPFLMHPPTYWVERELRAELHDDVKVYTAAAELVGHRWRCSEAELFLKDGELSVECGEARESEYLRGLSQRVRRSWLLPSSLDGSMHSRVEEGAEFSIHCQLPLSLDGLVLTRGLPETVRAGLVMPPSVVLVGLDLAADTTEPTLIPASAEGRAMQVVYPRNDNPGIAGIFLSNEGREYLRLPVTWEGLHAEIGVFRATQGLQQDGSVWRDVITALEAECRYSDVPEIFVLPAFWLDPADFWRSLSERSGSESNGRTWMAGIVGALRKLPSSVLETLLEALFRDRRLDQLSRAHPELADLDPTAKALVSRKQRGTHGAAAVPRSCERVIAFDTSSFIQFDQLVDHLLPTDFLVFPQAVAGEVERKKGQHEDFRIISRRNLRAIRRLPEDRWAAPFHDYSFLAPSDIQNVDGQIIATLVPYSQAGSKVILVTQDGDFVARCKPYGIESMTAEMFMGHPKAQRKGAEQ